MIHVLEYCEYNNLTKYLVYFKHIIWARFIEIVIREYAHCIYYIYI